MTTPPGRKVDGPRRVGWWQMFWLIMFGCRHREWFNSFFGVPTCARCLRRSDHPS